MTPLLLKPPTSPALLSSVVLVVASLLSKEVVAAKLPQVLILKPYLPDENAKNRKSEAR
jgi:hypothetical protein